MASLRSGGAATIIVTQGFNPGKSISLKTQKGGALAIKCHQSNGYFGGSEQSFLMLRTGLSLLNQKDLTSPPLGNHPMRTPGSRQSHDPVNVKKPTRLPRGSKEQRKNQMGLKQKNHLTVASLLILLSG